MLINVCILPLSLLVQAPPPLPHAGAALPAQAALHQPLLPRAFAHAIFPSTDAHPLFPSTTVQLADANTPFAEPEGIRIDTVVSLVAPLALAYAVFTGFSKLWELFSKNF